MKRNPALKVPYSPTGQLMHHPGPRDGGRDSEGVLTYSKVGEWRPNHEFDAVLKFKGTARGRSAAYFLWEDEAGNTWPMFISDVGSMITEGMHLEPGGVVSGRWFVVKRGQNFGITPVVKD